MTSTQIHRHTRLSIFMHWFNAGCWIFLLLTGLGLIRNDDLQPFTSWPTMLRHVFGGGANLLLAHEIVGITWAGGFLLYGIIRLKSDVLPFIREIFTVDIRRDFLWLITKGIQMTLGYQDAWRSSRINSVSAPKFRIRVSTTSGRKYLPFRRYLAEWSLRYPALS